jgi:hypothetical protein
MFTQNESDPVRIVPSRSHPKFDNDWKGNYQKQIKKIQFASG